MNGLSAKLRLIVLINLKETKAYVNIYKKLVFVCITFPLQDYSEKSTGISFYDALECRLFVSAPKNQYK